MMPFFIGIVLAGLVTLFLGFVFENHVALAMSTGFLLFVIVLVGAELHFNYRRIKKFDSVTKERIAMAERGEVVHISVTRLPPSYKWWQFWKTM